ncbi:GNAT family N-acetyltransferase [Vagococcus carniphilus]|uniref:GNAT family N-acetyltransferase n=1 Tax=Vagococcus carniphilus TaxID=218144 RepID=UPI00288DEC00|nr:GNAT family N-acetyltransferase [Vagococcus carniphilus]MDT2815932.1 GNAT family N-acetyltransferase [Vagococcus carniphilus]MDT2864308.1 GNAT family N-acetyltransferase [Vagococcus carniphilus]
MHVRLGNLEDLKQTDDILKDVAKKLKNKGSMQWSEILDGKETPVLIARLKQKEVIILEDEQEIIGLVYIYQDPSTWDKSLWHDEKIRDVYYLHKVAIKNNANGKNYGQLFLKEIINWVKRLSGTQIRLDCKADISYLNQFYPSVGFEFVGLRKQSDYKELNSDFNLYSYNISQE